MYIHIHKTNLLFLSNPHPNPDFKKLSLTRGKFCRFTWKPERFADYLAAGTEGRRVSRYSVWPYHPLSVGWDSNQHMALPTWPCGAGSPFYLPASGVCSSLFIFRHRLVRYSCWRSSYMSGISRAKGRTKMLCDEDTQYYVYMRYRH